MLAPRFSPACISRQNGSSIDRFGLEAAPTADALLASHQSGGFRPRRMISCRSKAAVDLRDRRSGPPLAAALHFEWMWRVEW
jgi:hypothetical protein